MCTVNPVDIWFQIFITATDGRDETAPPLVIHSRLWQTQITDIIVFNKVICTALYTAIHTTNNHDETSFPHDKTPEWNKLYERLLKKAPKTCCALVAPIITGEGAAKTTTSASSGIVLS